MSDLAFFDKSFDRTLSVFSDTQHSCVCIIFNRCDLMNIFVSYTTRNNEVTINSLINFSNKINSLGKIFIDLIDNNSDDKQNRVVKELEKAELLILIKSKSVLSSEWVKFEIESANEKNIPIIEFNINDIDNLTEQEIANRITVEMNTKTPNA